jgi:hypothetical protein
VQMFQTGALKNKNIKKTPIDVIGVIFSAQK